MITLDSIVISGLSNPLRSQVVTLTAQMILDKEFTIVETLQAGQAILLIPKNGPAQVKNLDYTVSGQTISWNGLGLDGILEENDILVVYY